MALILSGGQTRWLGAYFGDMCGLMRVRFEVTVVSRHDESRWLHGYELIRTAFELLSEIVDLRTSHPDNFQSISRRVFWFDLCPIFGC
jgi:hypothetical protein